MSVWTTGTNVERPKAYVPVDQPNREHSKDGAFRHRQGRVRGLKEYNPNTPASAGQRLVPTDEGMMVGLVRSESITKIRKSMEGSRSKAARVSASGKAEIFVKTNRDIDKRIDNPARPIEVSTARKFPGLGRQRRMVR